MQREVRRQWAGEGAKTSSVLALSFEREARGDVFWWKWHVAFLHRKCSARSQAPRLSRAVNLFGHGHERGRDAWEKENSKNRLEAASKEAV